MATTLSGNKTVTGLGAYTVTLSSAGTHTVRVMIPGLQPGSGIQITIAQSGSASKSITSPAPSTGQTHLDVILSFNAAPGDIATITLASSNAVDQTPNAFQAQIQTRLGVN